MQEQGYADHLRHGHADTVSKQKPSELAPNDLAAPVATAQANSSATGVSSRVVNSSGNRGQTLAVRLLKVIGFLLLGWLAIGTGLAFLLSALTFFVLPEGISSTGVIEMSLGVLLGMGAGVWLAVKSWRHTGKQSLG